MFEAEFIKALFEVGGPVVAVVVILAYAYIKRGDARGTTEADSARAEAAVLRRDHDALSQKVDSMGRTITEQGMHLVKLETIMQERKK